MNRIITIRVSMHQLQPLLTPVGACWDGHRGIWFYDPAVVGAHVAVGDRVRFERYAGGGVVAGGVVTGLIEPADHPKFCSRLNTHGFTWADDAVSPTAESGKELQS